MANETYAVFDTTEGKFKIKLFADKVPNTVKNFVELADGTKTGKPFYDGTVFHRVIPDFMIQGGCPTGDGTGGPGYSIKCEINLNKHLAGSLSMAHRGKNTGGSQFFVCHSPQAHLDGVHTVFGGTQDMSVVKAIRAGDKMNEVIILEGEE
jgi:peptidyl-prolyl cis-trans isomerase B (cyclophilin B)